MEKSHTHHTLIRFCKIVSVAQEMWNFIFSLFGIPWVIPSGVAAQLECWKKSPTAFGAFGWKGIPDVFEGIERNILELKWSLIHTLWDWNNAYGEVYFHYVLDF